MSRSALATALLLLFAVSSAGAADRRRQNKASGQIFCSALPTIGVGHTPGCMATG